jgi:hypothetical protein
VLIPGGDVTVVDDAEPERLDEQPATIIITTVNTTANPRNE